MHVGGRADESTYESTAPQTEVFGIRTHPIRVLQACPPPPVPDAALLRVLACSMVLWDRCMPTEDWLLSNVPTV